ncbi:MAG: hypothetical protein AAGK28_12425, partial [Pseudomonadota bacterium]
MKKLLGQTAVAAIAISFAGEALATEWNVSLWGKRRAFTEHVEKLAELVDQKTGGELERRGGGGEECSLWCWWGGGGGEWKGGGGGGG